MSASTTKLGLTKPGGGSTGVITPGEIVDIDVLNGNFDKIDEASGAGLVTSTTRPASPFSGKIIYESDTQQAAIYSGGQWIYLGAALKRLVAFKDNATYNIPDFSTVAREGGEFSFPTIVGHRYVIEVSGQGGQVGANGQPTINLAFSNSANPAPATTQTGVALTPRLFSGTGTLTAAAIAIVGTTQVSFVAQVTNTYFKFQGSSTAAAFRFVANVFIYDVGSVLG